MANTVIQLKHSTLTGNVPSSLANGEISINSRDGKFFYSTPAGVVVTHYPYPGPAGLNQEIQFNDSGVLGTNSGLTFSKTTGVFTAPIVASSNNGNGTNFRVGDDAWIGDVNLADTLRISGQQNVNNAYIVFGASNANTLGRAGTGPLTYTGDFKATGLVSGNELTSTQSSGDEGGQVNLAIPATNTSLVSSVTIDVFQNKLRFFQGDSAKGAYIDLTAASAGVGTNLLLPSSSTDGFARTQANAAFIQANAAFLQANTPDNVANSAASYANSAFLRANTPSDVANSAASYANSAFGRANTAAVAANTPSATANSAALYANAAFTRANNSLDANNGGTVTGSLTVSGNVTTSQYFIGDGSKLTGLSPALQIYNLANTSSDVSDYMVLKSLDAYSIGTQNTTTKTVTTTPTILTSFISDVGFPNITSIPSGDIVVEFDTQKTSGVGGYYCYAEIYKRTVGGTETLIATTGNSSSSTLNSQIQQRVNAYVSTPVSLVVSDRIVVKIYAVMLTTSASISILFDGVADGAFTLPTLPASTLNFVPYINATANIQLNSYSLITQTVSANSVVVLGRNLDAYANAAFLQANTPSHVANSAASYANSAFARANTAAVAANTPSATANSAASYANSAFTRANNSLDANNGGTVTGTITATSFITTGSFGNILGANTIYANNFVANTGFIQFADGSKQYTANAGSGGGGTTDWGFGIIYTANNNTFANAAAANSQVNFVGESGVVVFANSVTKTITVAGTPGAQGLTVDYGFVNDPIYYSIDYGSLA